MTPAKRAVRAGRLSRELHNESHRGTANGPIRQKKDALTVSILLHILYVSSFEYVIIVAYNKSDTYGCTRRARSESSFAFGFRSNCGKGNKNLNRDTFSLSYETQPRMMLPAKVRTMNCKHC